jgi:hypothetical protein
MLINSAHFELEGQPFGVSTVPCASPLRRPHAGGARLLLLINMVTAASILVAVLASTQFLYGNAGAATMQAAIHSR